VNGQGVRRSVTDHVDFCITTFKRPDALKRLLYSIAAHYAGAAIYVADQNEALDRAFYADLTSGLIEEGLETCPTVFDLQFDCGISVARNHLVRSTPRAYKLILDDDFVFTHETRLERFLSLLDANGQAGVVGGVVNCDGHRRRFDFRIERRGQTLRQIADDSTFRDHQGIRYRPTDSVLNFALMRQALFEHTQWDPELKVAEHLDFYLGVMEGPYSVLFTPDVVVDHPPLQRDPAYVAYRYREEFFTKAFRKHRLTRVETIGGEVVELGADGAIVHRG
jgi:Glycosyl transferase family 2